MNDEKKQIFKPLIVQFGANIENLNTEIADINNDRRYSVEFKREKVAEIVERKQALFETLERDLIALADTYKPEYKYKPLPLEVLNRISALLAIARSNGKTIDDKYLMTLLRDYVAEYDLMDFASTFPRLEAFPECFAKEMDYLSKVDVFEAFRAEIVEIAKTRQEASYNWERLKLMTHYNGMPF